MDKGAFRFNVARGITKFSLGERVLSIELPSRTIVLKSAPFAMVDSSKRNFEGHVHSCLRAELFDHRE